MTGNNCTQYCTQGRRCTCDGQQQFPGFEVAPRLSVWGRIKGWWRGYVSRRIVTKALMDGQEYD